MIRILVASLSVVVGVGFGITVAPACSPDCGCVAVPPLQSGEFKIDEVELSSGANDDLRDVTVTGVRVNETTVDLLYHRAGTPGAVTYRATFKSVNGFSEVLDDVDAGGDAATPL